MNLDSYRTFLAAIFDADLRPQDTRLALSITAQRLWVFPLRRNHPTKTQGE